MRKACLGSAFAAVCLLFLSTNLNAKPAQWTYVNTNVRVYQVVAGKDGVLYGTISSNYNQPSGLHQSSDGGKTWTAVAGTPFTGNVTLIRRSDGAILVTASSGAKLGTFIQDGKEWKKIFSNHGTVTGFTQKGFPIVQYGHDVLIGREGNKYEYVDIGGNANSNVACENGDICFGTDRGIALYTEKDAKVDLLKDSPSGITQIYPAEKGEVVALNSSGEIYSSSNKLTKWTKEATPGNLYPLYRNHQIALFATRGADTRVFQLHVAGGKVSLKDLGLPNLGITGVAVVNDGIRVFFGDGRYAFQRVGVVLTVNATGGGEVTVANGESESFFRIQGKTEINKDFLVGDKLTLEAKPAEVFNCVRGEGSPETKPTLSLELKTTKTDISAVFEKQ